MGSIYYHGTDEKTSKIILANGFKIGTYFTWDLHSALVMGGMWVFGVYFEDKNPSDYWEWITDFLIMPDRILYLRKFEIKCVFDNDCENERIKEIFHKENYGHDIIVCKNCRGTGQMNESAKYSGWGKVSPVVCEVCRGYGCLKLNGKKMNED